ncbi:MAG TPA: hypothetical protein VGB69_00450 [Edaphobacter sp.]
MAHASQKIGSSQEVGTSRQDSQGKLFGIPLGELGWFASLLIGGAIGAMGFFISTFLGIVSIMVYNSTAHAAVDYALSYRRAAIVGVALALIAWGYLGTLWVKRITRHS